MIIRYADTGEVVVEKNADYVRPIASVTKLLSALTIGRTGDIGRDPNVTICEDDKDRVKWSRSRLLVGTTCAPEDLYALALIASDNRAMYALVRSKRESRAAFVDEMNAVARELGMAKSSFRDPAGIDPGNVSTARDLLQLLEASAADVRIAQCTTRASVEIETDRGLLRWTNTNRLVGAPQWNVVLGKTGYTVEAGRNLVMRVTVGGRPVDMVFLGARERLSAFGDAGRVRRWLLDRMKPQPS